LLSRDIARLTGAEEGWQGRTEATRGLVDAKAAGERHEERACLQRRTDAIAGVVREMAETRNEKFRAHLDPVAPNEAPGTARRIDGCGGPRGLRPPERLRRLRKRNALEGDEKSDDEQATIDDVHRKAPGPDGGDEAGLALGRARVRVTHVGLALTRIKIK
jgi:hypothetical protein